MMMVMMTKLDTETADMGGVGLDGAPAPPPPPPPPPPLPLSSPSSPDEEPPLLSSPTATAAQPPPPPPPIPITKPLTSGGSIAKNIKDIFRSGSKTSKSSSSAKSTSSSGHHQVSRSSSSVSQTPSEEYLQQHRPSIPSSTTVDSTPDESPRNSIYDNSSELIMSPPRSGVNLTSSTSFNGACDRPGTGTTTTTTTTTMVTDGHPTSKLSRFGSLMSINLNRNGSNAGSGGGGGGGYGGNRKNAIKRYQKKEPRGVFLGNQETSGIPEPLMPPSSVPSRPVSFTDELLEQTKPMREQLDDNNINNNTDVETDQEPDDGSKFDDHPSEQQKLPTSPGTSIMAAISRHLVSVPTTNEGSHTDRIFFIADHKDTRAHIVGELYDTEKNYCDILKTLYETFISPFAVADNNNVIINDNIQFMVHIANLMPAVLDGHGKFLEQLRRRIAEWSPDQTRIGDIFEFLDKSDLIKFYLCFIEYWKGINSVLKRSQRQFDLDNLLISVIQRIPRYEQILKRLVEKTDNEHIDYQSLQQAIENIHKLLVNIGTYPQQQQQNIDPGLPPPRECLSEGSTPIHEFVPTDGSHRQLYVKDLGRMIEGAQSILDQHGSNSFVHLYDYVYIRKRERAIFVLDTCILICQTKNKKKSEFFEYNKFKLQQVIKLENVELRCQCWQQRGQGSNISNLSITGGSVTGGGGVGGGAGQSLADWPMANAPMNPATAATACRTCIETLDSDIRCILKMQEKASGIATTAIRISIESMLTEQLQLVIKQYAEMNEILSRCSKDCNVDMFMLSESDRDSIHIYDWLMATAANQQLATEKKVRTTHNKCQQHHRALPGLDRREPEYSSIAFTSFKKREEFETIVIGLRAKIVKSRFRLDFLCQIPYQKARAGIQFTCALPALGTNNIWICKSDGFVGQISVLSMDNFDEPTVVSSNGVCNARILCLKAVEARVTPDDDSPTRPPVPGTSMTSPQISAPTPPTPQLSTSSTSQRNSLIWQLNKSTSESQNDDTDGSENESIANQSVRNNRKYSSTLKSSRSPSRNNNYRSPPIPLPPPAVPLSNNTTTTTTIPSNNNENETDPEQSLPPVPPPAPPPPVPETNINNHNHHHRSSTLPRSSSMASASVSSVSNPVALISPNCPTMWFGTDDCTIYIYSCFDAVRIGRNKAKVTLNSRVESIEYFQGRVFVGLANHTVATFTRDGQGYWQTTPEIIEGIHCYRFCVVNGEQLWTTSSNLIQIRDAELNPIEEPIIVKDIDKISFIVANNNQNVHPSSLFVASQNSLYIYRYGTEAPYPLLSSIFIGPSVDKALSDSEEIIRHHKNACLKICTMHVVRDRILIGTSAGVILILDNKNNLEIVPNGHAGYVRFITSTISKDGRLMVVSGGDGAERYSPGSNVNSHNQGEFHFMSYCRNLLGRSSSNSNIAATATTAISPTIVTTAATPTASSGPETTNPETDTSSVAAASPENLSSPPPPPPPPLPSSGFHQQRSTVSGGNSDADVNNDDSKSHLLVWRVV